MLPSDFREFLKLLDKHSARYVVVGGYAMAIHGRPRYTGDLDIFVASDPANAHAVVNALHEFGFAVGDREEALLQQAHNIIELGNEPLKLQIMTSISGLKFDECFARRLATDVDGVQLPCISREDFIINKRAAHRPQDLADIQALEPSNTA